MIDRKILKFLKKSGVEYKLVKKKDHYLCHINGSIVVVGNNSSKALEYLTSKNITALAKAIDGGNG